MVRISIALLFFVTLESFAADQCQLLSEPVTLYDEPGKFLQYQIESDRPVFWGEDLLLITNRQF